MCGKASRLLSFALLLAAVVGYCGLPSNPPAGLFASAVATLVEAGSKVARPKFVAPTQAKECRGRDTLADAHAHFDMDAPGGLTAAPPAVVAPVGKAARHGQECPSLVQAAAAGASARSPPLAA